MAAALQRLALVLDNISDGFFTLDRELRYLDINRSGAALVGSTPEKLIGRKLLDVFPEAAGSIWERTYRQVLDTGLAATAEEYYEPLDQWFEASVFPFAGGVSVFFRDVSHRRRAERVVQVERDRLRQIFNAQFGFMAELAPDGTVLEINRTSLLMMGVTRDQVLGRLFCEIGWLAGSARPGVRNAMAIAARGQVWRGDIVATFPQVGHRVVDTVFSPVFDHRGAVTSVIAFGIDVTDRALLQERLQQAQQLASIGNFDQDFASNTIWWSDETYRLMGSPPGSRQPSYERFLDAIHPDDRAAVDAEYRRSLRECRSYDFDCRLQVPDGVVRHVRAQVRTSYDADGQPVRTQGTLQDVSRFVRADMLARESELFFAAAFHDNPIGMGLRRLKDNVIIEVNGAFLAMFGLRREQVAGRTVAALNLYADPQARGRISEAQEDREPLRNVEMQCRHSSGQLRDVVMTMNYITVNGEECALCSFVDDSERRRAALTIQNALAEKETLLREIHHRVKNNLQMVSSFLHFQSKKASTPEYQASIAAIRERLIAMTLVHEKLYWSRDVEHIDFADYVRSLVAEVLRTRPAQAHVSMNIEADDIQLPIEIALPSGMIVCELVTNTLKYAFPSSGPGVMSVRVDADGEHVVVSVDDDGVGFPPNFSAESGNSFGWALILSLTQQIHGAVVATSAHGAHVRLTFPARVPEEGGS